MLESLLVVNTAADSYDLTVLATVKRELNIDDAKNDEQIADLIHRASSSIARYCGRVFAKENVTETFRRGRTFSPALSGAADALQLTRFPVVSIGSILEDGVALTAADYEYDADAGKLFRLDDLGNRTRWCAQITAITYDGGYQLVSGLDFDIEEACIGLVKRAWFGRGRDPLVKVENVPGVLEQQFWVGAIGENAEFPPDIAAKIDRYRVFSF